MCPRSRHRTPSRVVALHRRSLCLLSAVLCGVFDDGWGGRRREVLFEDIYGKRVSLFPRQAVSHDIGQARVHFFPAVAEAVPVQSSFFCLFSSAVLEAKQVIRGRGEGGWHERWVKLRPSDWRHVCVS